MLTGERLNVGEARYVLHDDLHDLILALIELGRQAPTCAQRVDGVVVIRQEPQARRESDLRHSGGDYVISGEYLPSDHRLVCSERRSSTINEAIGE